MTINYRKLILEEKFKSEIKKVFQENTAIKFSIIFNKKNPLLYQKTVVFVLLEHGICFRVIGLVESYVYYEFGKLYLL